MDANEIAQQAIRDHDAVYPNWHRQAREREQQEIEDRAQRERKAKRRLAAGNADAWCAWVNGRIEVALAGFEFNEVQTEALGEVIASERADRLKEIKAAVAEATRALEAKIADLEKRLHAATGKLPVAKAWREGCVTYQGELVTYDGELHQALCDTGQKPGSGSDWLVVARAGQDARWPAPRGTFDEKTAYAALDIVALNGGSFIALHDNPGQCPGPGWQLIARQGQRGVAGERGPRGEQGPPGLPAPSIKTWLIDAKRYVATPIMSDGSHGPDLELRELFRQFQEDTA
jgi:hypothetical protein